MSQRTKNINIELPKPCPVKNISKDIPKVLYEYISKQISRIYEILEDPVKYEIERNEYEKGCHIPHFGIFAFDETNELNKFSDVVEQLTTKPMIGIWNKFYELNPSSLPSLFIFIQNKYSQITNKNMPKYETKEQKQFNKHIEEYKKLIKNPSELIEIAEKLYDLLEEFGGVIIPDGADYYEYLDMDASEITRYVDWDTHIKDDEYDIFMELLYKIITKLHNRKNKKESEYRKNIEFLENPKTRKNKFSNAPQIFMIRVLYLRFIELFNKPLYKEISTIIAELFQSEYTENEIIKITTPLRDKIDKILKELRKNNFVKYTDSSHIEEILYKKIQ